tara:strand:- start:372 stop:668 length:297 start_codon:yes stop_codon:yes gene_type:complete
MEKDERDIQSTTRTTNKPSILIQRMEPTSKTTNIRLRHTSLEEEHLERCIKSSVIDVINRMHKIEGGDRYAFLMEHLEWLCCDEEEVIWANKISGEEL